MGIKDRRRRRTQEASRYGDEETQSSESNLTAEQTFSHVIEHEGAIAVKGEQLLVLLTVCFPQYCDSTPSRRRSHTAARTLILGWSNSI